MIVKQKKAIIGIVVQLAYTSSLYLNCKRKVKFDNFIRIIINYISFIGSTVMFITHVYLSLIFSINFKFNLFLYELNKIKTYSEKSPQMS